MGPIARWLGLAPLLCAWACFAPEAPPAVGTLERDRLDLVAESSEPVVARPIPEGGFAEAGALLVKLDPTRLAARVRQAAGARDQAAARLAELVRGPRRERIAEARALLRGAQSRLSTASEDLARARNLSAQGVVSAQQLDDALVGVVQLDGLGGVHAPATCARSSVFNASGKVLKTELRAQGAGA